MSYTLIPGKPHKIGTEAETIELVRNVLTEELSEARRHRRRSVLLERIPAEARLAEVTECFEPLAESDRLTFREVADINWPVRIASFGAVLALLIIKPLWVLVPVLALAVLYVLIVHFMGADRLWLKILRWIERVEVTDPERAHNARSRLDLAAYQWDRVLDLFPQRVAGKLYMPSFRMPSYLLEQKRKGLR